MIVERGSDKPWSMGNASGQFTVQPTWNMIRNKKRSSKNMTWYKGKRNPFKINFFLCKACKGRIATDDNLKWMRIPIVSKYWYFEGRKEETIKHLFVTTPIAQWLWKFLSHFAVIKMERIELHQAIMEWWNKDGNNKLRKIYNAVPALIILALWKRRNGIRHGKDVGYIHMVQHVLTEIDQMVQLLYSRLRRTGREWRYVIKDNGSHKNKIYHHLVTWKTLEKGRYEYSTDRASRGNPGLGSFSFVLRNHNGIWSM